MKKVLFCAFSITLLINSVAFGQRRFPWMPEEPSPLSAPAIERWLRRCRVEADQQATHNGTFFPDHAADTRNQCLQRERFLQTQISNS